MISVPTVRLIHQKLIEKYGGSDGIRDLNLLESALARPFMTFDGNELYDDFEKAAAILESILINHPFIDGNKRTGFVLCELFLRKAGYTFTVNEEEKYEFIIEISMGNYDHNAITQWLKNNTSKL